MNGEKMSWKKEEKQKVPMIFVVLIISLGIISGAVLLSQQPTPQSSLPLLDEKKGELKTPQDSFTALFQSPGKPSYYTRSCTYIISLQAEWDNFNQTVTFYETDCEEPDGQSLKNFPPNPAGNFQPPACDAGDIPLTQMGSSPGVDCHASGITSVDIKPLGIGVNGTYIYPHGGVGVDGTTYVAVGICDRICRKG